MKFIDRFHEEFHNLHTYLVFRTALFVWCLINILIMACDHQSFWGAESFIVPIGELGSDRMFEHLDLLSRPEWSNSYGFVIAAYIALLLLGISQRKLRFTTLGIWFLNTVLMLRCHFVFDGGDRLAMHMLFYCGVIDLLDTSRPAFREFATVLRNGFFFFCKIQICLLYACAAFTKLGGELWPSGMALSYIVQSDEYTLPFLKQLSSWEIFWSMGTYMTLLYQLTFPILIWSFLRRWVVVVGTFLHLQIALVMGVFSFGILLCVCYLVFAEQEDLDRWTAVKERIWTFVHRIWHSLFKSALRT